MKQHWVLGLALMIGMPIVACSDGSQGSGVVGTKKLVDLNDSEDRSLCTYVANVAGPARIITCSNGATFKFGNDPDKRQTAIDDCVRHNNQLTDNFPMCGVTAGEYEGCIEVLADMPDADWCDPNKRTPAICIYIVTPPPECGGPVALN